MPSDNNKWEILKTSARQEVKPEDFRMIEPLVFLGEDDNTIFLEAPNQHITGWFEERNRPYFEQLAVRIFNLPYRFQISNKVTGPQNDVIPSRIDSAKITDGLNEALNFDNFIVGDCNKFANAAARAICNQPFITYNPLYIYASTGLGKTHLMHAIGNEYAIRYPDLQVIYVTAEDFMNEFIISVRNGNIGSMREKYRRKTNLLLVDDIQVWSKAQQTQTEFFHTFNALIKAQCQIVLVSDQEPEDIKGLEPRLLSRFQGGLIADMQAPNRETLLAILMAKCQEMDLNLPTDLCFTIAHTVIGNIRKLEGILKTLKNLHDLSGETITLESVQKHLPNLLKSAASQKPTVEKIQAAIGKTFGVETSELLGNSRKKQITLARHSAMYMSRVLTDLSFPELGKKFNRDHSSIQHGYKKAKKLIIENANYEGMLFAVLDLLGLPPSALINDDTN